jgi:hypothetical protein
MSAIASFYLVRNQDIDRLKELATQPVGRSAKGKWSDPYWEFLVANARELEQYGWSGHVMGDVSLYLDSRSAKLDEFCDKALSDFFCKARRSSIFAFRAAAGEKLAQLIEANWPDETSLRAFLDSPDMTSPVGEAVPIEAVLDGLRILKNWLSQVDAGNLGLLSIG